MNDYDNLYIGLLSGTSMDAVDAALVSFQEKIPKIIKTLNYPIPHSFRKSCLNTCQTGMTTIDEYGSLDAFAGELFAEAVLALLNDSEYPREKISAIGSHGQTLRHCPSATPPFTLQIGDPNIIAERTSIPTVADFRRRDIAAGGQGAPLAPAFHASVLGCQTQNRIIVNVGGISNISIIPCDTTQPILGFDTGPGNCLMDLWTQKNWGKYFDNEGSIAASGEILPELLSLFLEDSFFKKEPPKSTGREYFTEEWLNSKLKDFQEIFPAKHFSAQDVQATLLKLTVESLCGPIKKAALDLFSRSSSLGFEQSNVDYSVFVYGGGAHNLKLMNELQKTLSCPVQNTETLGIPPDWMEAVLFAWLAKQTLEGKSGNCPTVTGAKRAISLGGIFGFVPRV